MNDSNTTAIQTIEDAPKRRGRKPGSPKVPGSGRKVGTKNHDRSATIARIMNEADPIAFLGGVMKSNKYPIENRLTAGIALLRRVMPELRATELSGPNGGPVQTEDKTDNPERLIGVARRIAYMMAMAKHAVELDQGENRSASRKSVRPALHPGRRPSTARCLMTISGCRRVVTERFGSAASFCGRKSNR